MGQASAWFGVLLYRIVLFGRECLAAQHFFWIDISNGGTWFNGWCPMGRAMHAVLALCSFLIWQLLCHADPYTILISCLLPCGDQHLSQAAS